MKRWICCAAAFALTACSVVKTQEMVNAEGRSFHCPGSFEQSLAANPLALPEVLKNRELCIEANRRRGWLPVQEVGQIPLRFREHQGTVFVAEVLPGFPTLKTLTPEDFLTAINGVPVVSLQDARERLFGVRGTGIKLTLSGPSGEMDVELTRE